MLNSVKFWLDSKTALSWFKTKIACEQASRRGRKKKISASAKQKNSESKAIGAGTGESPDTAFDL